MLGCYFVGLGGLGLAFASPTTTAPQPYHCTKTTSLGTATAVTGISTAPKPIASKGFKLGITGLLTNDSTHIDDFFSVVHDVNRPSDLFALSPQFGHGAVGYWPNWPDATFVQEPATGRLAIADAVLKDAKQYWLSVGIGGANVSMRSTLAAGEAWIVCDTLRANQSASCRPSTSKQGAKGYNFWSPPDSEGLCESNFGPANISTHFSLKQPANEGTNPDTNVDCPDFKAYEVLAIEASVPPKQQLYYMNVKSQDPQTNGLFFDVGYNTTGQVVWSIWSEINDGIFSFDRSFYNGTRRIVAHDPGNTLTYGYGTVDYTRGPAVFASQKPTGSQQALECIIDSHTSELKCSVNGQVYQWQAPEIPAGKDQPPVLFGPCVRRSDENDYVYTPASIYATEVFHFTSDVSTGYNYGG